MKPVITRRAFVGKAGTATLSATAVALLVGCESMARSSSVQSANASAGDPANDVAILNVALGLEHEAIGAYQLGAESGLLSGGVLDTAVLFQSQHKEHRDAIAGAIKQLGGTPVESETLAHYAESLNAASIKNATDILKLAARLEKGAANAYLGVIPAFDNSDFAQIAGRLAADETMHWTVLATALGQELPRSALTFGA
ncbi:MAG: ferritin-like domain-containing protein [Kiloniellales bacterium]|nr:ferritin-like domain-containing protein [Kiloniellales bacterium]